MPYNMGKPPRDSKSSQSTSVHRNNKKKMNAPMSSKKARKQLKRNRSKTSASIRKLFNQLRNESLSSISSIENVDVDKKSCNKRKLSPNCSQTKVMSKRKKVVDNNASVIILDDSVHGNDVQCTGTVTPKKPLPVHSSTPIIKKNTECITIEPKTERTTNNNLLAVHNLNEGIRNLSEGLQNVTDLNVDTLVTIDLTNESLDCSAISRNQNTVIDLENINEEDCTLVHESKTNLSMSGDSEVTVLNVGSTKKERQMKKFAKGIAKLDASEKGRLLELITQNIFTGCNVRKGGPSKPQNTQATETVEDTYIKEVILGQVPSRNSIGSNIYNPEKDTKHKTGLRMIVIDGSNVAMTHARGRFFSVKGLKICIEYFLKRGHTVKAFVPRFRCKFGKSSDPRLLDDLERQGHVVYTPSREIQGRMVTSYDDRYIVQCAAEFDGVIVSGDNYRDLLRENQRWRFVIENRLLPFTWVEDMLMFPRDPLGRNGPSLEEFLKHTKVPNTQNATDNNAPITIRL